MDWLTLETAGEGSRTASSSKASLLKIIVPKKAAKNATRRNRIRRLIKEAVRLDFERDKSRSYTFRVLKDPGDIGLSETKKAVHAVWKR